MVSEEKEGHLRHGQFRLHSFIQKTNKLYLSTTLHDLRHIRRQVRLLFNPQLSANNQHVLSALPANRLRPFALAPRCGHLADLIASAIPFYRYSPPAPTRLELDFVIASKFGVCT